MRTQISGRQIDIGEALQTHVKDALASVFEKFSQRPTDAQVVFSRSGHEHVCETVVHLSTGMSAQATGRAGEIYAAFESAAEKLEKQLRRYKRRLKDHHSRRTRPIDMIPAASYVLEAGTDAGGEEPDTLQPMIVAEGSTGIPELSVGEAVMQMELKGAPVLVFSKEGSAGLNVVYRREDGNIGWIDPSGGQRAQE